ncbi:MAG: PhzF family phenazine biosynthesis protein [Fibrobacteria bacterium]
MKKGKAAQGHPFSIVDVFAEAKYAGNQLAVVRPASALTDAEMQRIAFEFNFPETTFIDSLRPRRGGFDVRIFTPRQEVPFAGHPTLGTAHVIRSLLDAAGKEGKAGKASHTDTIVLNLKVGPVPVRFEAGDSGLRWMRPEPPKLGRVHEPKAAAKILGLSAKDIDPDFPVQEAAIGMAFLMIPLRNLDAVKRAATDLPAYRKYFAGRGEPALPLFLFSRETYSPESRINCRMFAELFGIPEDPATGSANACLAGYLVKHGYFGKGGIGGKGRVRIQVEQGYEMGRKSLLQLDAGMRNRKMEVAVGGRVIAIAQGMLI